MDNADALIKIAIMAFEALMKNRASLTDEQRAQLDANFGDYQVRIARAEANAAPSEG